MGADADVIVPVIERKRAAMVADKTVSTDATRSQKLIRAIKKFKEYQDNVQMHTGQISKGAAVLEKRGSSNNRPVSLNGAQGQKLLRVVLYKRSLITFLRSSKFRGRHLKI